MEKDYVILNIEQEYPDFSGTEKWIIITDLSEEEFAKLYPEEQLRWKEAVIMSEEMGKEIIRFRRNESKHEMRRHRTEISLENTGDIRSPAPARKDVCSVSMARALLSLTPTQRQRVIKHCVYGCSVSDIAEEEGCGSSAVYNSIRKGLKKLKGFEGLEESYRIRRLIR